MAGLIRYCLFGVLLVPALSFSATRHIVVEPGQLQRTYTQGQPAHAFWDSRNWSEPVSTQSGSKINVPVASNRKFTWPTWRNAVSTALKLNPVRTVGSVAVGAAVAAAGWFIEDNTLKKEECLVDGMPSDTCEVPIGNMYQYGICHLPASETMGGSVKIGQFGDTLYAHTVVPNAQFETMLSQGWYHVGNCFSKPLGYTTDANAYWPGSFRRPIFTHELERVKVPVTSGEIDGMVGSYPWSSPDGPEAAPHVEAANPGSWDSPDEHDFTGPSSMPGPAETSTTSSSGGTTVIESVTNYNFQYNTNPLSITTTTTTTNNTYNNGTQSSTETVTDGGVVIDAPPSQLEIPTDCEFMPTVCAFIEWFKEPIPMPEPEFPEVADEDFERSHTVSFGGACPAPTAISTQLFGTVYFNWQPLCDLAGFIRYLVISGALLFAIYISLGISRNS